MHSSLSNRNKSLKKAGMLSIKMVPLSFKYHNDLVQVVDSTGESSLSDRTDADANWRKIDSKEMNRNCSILSKTLYVIYRERFLKPISQIKIDYENILKGVKDDVFGKILITDDRSYALLEDVIKPETLKMQPIGISCQYNINDRLPKQLLKSYHTIYLICINQLSDKEFNRIKTNISEEKSGSYSIFSTYISSDCDRKRINEFTSLASVSKTSEVIQLGAFQCIDENIVVIDNNPNMDWLAEYKICSREMSTDYVMINRIGKRLANLFEHLGQFPAVFRYMKSFHQANKLIAEVVLKEMKKIAAKRRESGEPKHNTDYELLIIDRSIDLITPIRHSSHFRPFVYNELEKNYINDSDLDYRKLKHISLTQISSITETLTKIKDKQKNRKNVDLIEKTNINIRNALQMIEKCKIRGYSELLNIEKALLGSENASSDSLRFSEKSLNDRNKYLKKFIKKADREVTNIDIIRLLIIYRLLKNDTNTNHIKDILKQKVKERQIDWTQIEDYVSLTQEVTNLKVFPQDKSVFATIVNNFKSNCLSEQLFPTLYSKQSSKPARRKLFLFVLGGLSYNDLISVPELYQNDVIFCANGLITPRMLLNSILFEDSTK